MSPLAEGPCESFLLLPGENLWSAGVRGFLYCLALAYVFVGVAYASDIFMCSIEIITSKRRTIVRWDEERQERVEREVLVWNATVANLTLMAFGSSAPEIMLAVVITLTNLGKDTSNDDGLGTFTIIGSAAFNLLIITAICIVSVPTPDVKRIQEVGVFMLTSAWSIFAYLWMLIVLVAISPNVIEPWEAWLTLAFFPIMVLTAYCQDNHWWCRRHKSVGVADGSQAVSPIFNNDNIGYTFFIDLTLTYSHWRFQTQCSRGQQHLASYIWAI